MQMFKKIKKKNTLITDKGIDDGLSKLSPERISWVINNTLKSETGSRFKAYMESCVNCGVCANACHHYLSNDNSPAASPVGKVKRSMRLMMKTRGRVTHEQLKEIAHIAYTECNMCRRCTIYCPFGIDTAYIISVLRRICHLLGVTPQYMQDTAHSHSATMNQMWVKDDEWIDSLHWQEDEARDEISDLRIPLEVEGADIIYSVIGPEPKFRTQLIYQAAVIMNAVGADWTMPATPGWDNSDMAMFSGDFELMGRLKRQHFETALRLRANRIVMGECGHAFRSVYDTGNRWLGWSEPPVPVVHAVEYFSELLDQGKIKVAQKIKETVTFHDPCNIVRGRGLHEKGREIVRAFCTDIVEMTPNREHNYCCNAGGGVINCGPPFKKKRVDSNSIKARQLANTGAKIVIAPCHNCHGGLEDIIEKHELEMKVMFLGDIIYQCMEKSGAEPL